MTTVLYMLAMEAKRRDAVGSIIEQSISCQLPISEPSGCVGHVCANASLRSGNTIDAPAWAVA
jgi:hypothetical protein